jgi:hypothetical protein
MSAQKRKPRTQAPSAALTPHQAALSPEQLKGLERVRAEEARARRIADHEKKLMEQVEAKSKEIFDRVNVDITPQQEARIKELLRERVAQNKLDKFDAIFSEVMTRVRAALERYRICAYHSAPNVWFDGRTDFKTKYRREIDRLAKAFGDAAKALEELTYFQLDALNGRHKEWFIIDVRTGPFTVNHHQAYPRKTSLVDGLRRIEEYLHDNSTPEINMQGPIKSECQANLRHDLRDVYQFATGRKAPKQTTDYRSGVVGGHFVSFVELVYEIAGIKAVAGPQVKRDPDK